jgi:hypothetical protein
MRAQVVTLAFPTAGLLASDDLDAVRYEQTG